MGSRSWERTRIEICYLACNCIFVKTYKKKNAFYINSQNYFPFVFKIVLYFLSLGKVRIKQWRIQDFPEGGANSQSGCANLIFFGRKLHENERILVPGGARPWRPLRSATVNSLLCGYPDSYSGSITNCDGYFLHE